jgi:ABC-type antimicrobial peptide transport system permease subunit
MAEIEVEGGSTGGASIWLNSVSPNYFETMGIPIVGGRSFGPGDRSGAPRVAVVSEALARSYFPEQALGKRFMLVSGLDERGETVEIIGVIRDIRFVNPKDEPIRMAFLSYDQFPGPFSYVQVRTGPSPQSLVAAVRRAILEVDSRLYLRGPEPLPDILSQILSRETVLSRASSLFAVIALLLACFGIYGVVSYLVASGRSELGIRLAIGAAPGVVLREVIVDAVKTVAPGVVAGIAGAWASGRFVESLLFGVSRHDPGTYAAVAAVLVVTTIAAAYFPARSASRTDPVEALRCE